MVFLVILPGELLCIAATSERSVCVSLMVPIDPIRMPVSETSLESNAPFPLPFKDDRVARNKSRHKIRRLCEKKRIKAAQGPAHAHAVDGIILD